MADYYDATQEYDDDLEDELSSYNSLTTRRPASGTPPAKRGRGASGAVTRGRGKGSATVSSRATETPPSPAAAPATKRSAIWTGAEYQVLHPVLCTLLNFRFCC